MTRRNDLLSAARKASEVVAQFRAQERIKDGYTRVDPDTIAGAAGVVVMYKPLDRLLGGFLREDDTPGIMVNIARSRGLVHMTCAHELGHYFLGHSSTADQTIEYGSTASIIEQQANYFAYNLLAPQWLIAGTMRRMGWTVKDLRNPAVVYQMSLRLGVSYSGMAWSLVRISALKVDEANALLKTQPKEVKAAALQGHSPADSTRDVWVLGKNDKDSIIEPAPGDQFIVDLPNHADSGQLWTADHLQSEGFTLQPLVVDARNHRPRPGENIVVGGSATTLRYELVPEQNLMAQAMAQAEVKRHSVTLSEKAPWSRDGHIQDELRLGAEFEFVHPGFSRSERKRRLADMKAA